MIIIVDPHSGIPVYRQLMDQIRFHVASGLLKPGDEIPSTRALSAQLGVNPMTISKAFGLLEEEGVLSRRPGLPLVVKAGKPQSSQANKLEQLRTALRPAATMARQLGIDERRAVSLFRKLLADTKR
jgi:GntR family transcriptional regulator